jgi:hypothetical protein
MDNALDYQSCWCLKAQAAVYCMGMLEQGFMLLPATATPMLLRELEAAERNPNGLPLGRINQPTDGTCWVRIRGYHLVSFL